MAYRQTAQGATGSQFKGTGNNVLTGNGQLSMPGMEEQLAREMARLKMDKEK